MRGKRSVTLDLKKKQSASKPRSQLVAKADALIEGLRPGVMERLGLGPDVRSGEKPAARLRPHDGLGPGRAARAARGPRHQLHRARRRAARVRPRKGEAPVPPLNLVGDFGGGGMLLGFGVACALLEAARSGQRPGGGRRDGGRRLAARRRCFAGLSGRQDAGREERGDEHPRYRRALVQRLRDQGRQVRLDRLDRDAVLRGAAANASALQDLRRQHDRKRWPEMQALFAKIFKIENARRVVQGVRRLGRLLRAGAVVVGGAARIRTMSRARASSRSANVEQPAPAPRFSRTPGAVRRAPPERGEGGRRALADWGF